MPDFAPNFTCRIRIRYTSLGRIHTQQWRCPFVGAGGAGAAAAITQIQTIYDAIGPGMPPDWAVLATSVAAEDSDIFLPFTGPVPVSGGSTPPDSVLKRLKATHLSFTGRSASGNRAVVYFYGYVANSLVDVADLTDDFRLLATEDATISGTVGALNTSPGLCANDGEVVFWNEYANIKPNDYWVKKTRSGA